MEPTGGDPNDRSKGRRPDETETNLGRRHPAVSSKIREMLNRCSDSMPLARGLCVTAIVLLSLGLWAGIWGVVALLASHRIN
jgi:hypothetical protein